MDCAAESKKNGSVKYAFTCAIFASMASIILGYGTHTFFDSSYLFFKGSI
jgi:hypothetical protein